MGGYFVPLTEEERQAVRRGNAPPPGEESGSTGWDNAAEAQRVVSELPEASPEDQTSELKRRYAKRRLTMLEARTGQHFPALEDLGKPGTEGSAPSAFAPQEPETGAPPQEEVGPWGPVGPSAAARALAPAAAEGTGAVPADLAAERARQGMGHGAQQRSIGAPPAATPFSEMVQQERDAGYLGGMPSRMERAGLGLERSVMNAAETLGDIPAEALLPEDVYEAGKKGFRDVRQQAGRSEKVGANVAPTIPFVPRAIEGLLFQSPNLMLMAQSGMFDAAALATGPIRSAVFAELSRLLGENAAKVAIEKIVQESLTFGTASAAAGFMSQDPGTPIGKRAEAAVEEGVGGAEAGAAFTGAGIAGGAGLQIAKRIARGVVSGVPSGIARAADWFAEPTNRRVQEHLDQATQAAQSAIALAHQYPGMGGDMTAMAAIHRQFPALDEHEIAQIWRDAQAATAGRPAGQSNQAATAAATPRPSRAQEQKQTRLDISKKAAALEAQVDRIGRGEAEAGDNAKLIAKQADELATQAQVLNEPELMDRITSIGARAEDYHANPPAPAILGGTKEELQAQEEARARDSRQQLKEAERQRIEEEQRSHVDEAPPEGVREGVSKKPGGRTETPLRQQLRDLIGGPTVDQLDDDALEEEWRQVTGSEPPTGEEEPAEKEGQPIYQDEYSNRPAMPYLKGQGGSVMVTDATGKTREVPYHYGVTEAENLQPSHVREGERMVPNPNVPEEVQRRGTINRDFVEGRATEGTFNPREILEPSPTAETGPPIALPQGAIPGGNHRAAILRRVYEQGGEAAERLKQELVKRAAGYGLDPADIEKMKAPAVARILEEPPKTGEELGRLSDDLNRTRTQSMTPEETAVVQSEKIHAETIGHFTDTFPDDGSMADYQKTAGGREFVEKLRKDGAIPADQENKLMRDGALTEEGRRYVENLVLGKALPDAKALTDTPPAIRQKLLKAAPSIVAASTERGWDLRKDLLEAVKVLRAARDNGLSVQDQLGQSDMFATPARSAELALFLDRSKPSEVVDRFRQWASAARATPEGQAELMPGEIKPPSERFAEYFSPREEERDLPGEAAAPADLFGQEEQTELTKVQQEARTRIERLTREMNAARDPEIRQALARRIADLYPTARVGEKISAEEMRVRAIAGRGAESTDQDQGTLLSPMTLSPEQLQALKERLTARAGGKNVEPLARPVGGGGPAAQPGGGGEPVPRPADAGQPAPTRTGPGAAGGGKAAPGAGAPAPKEKYQATRSAKEKLKRQQEEQERNRQLQKEQDRLRDTRDDQEFLDRLKVKNVPTEVQAAIRRSAAKAGMTEAQAEGQVRDIARVTDALYREKDPAGGALVANAAGTGKTYVALGVVRTAQLRDPEARILLHVDNQLQAQQWISAAKDAFGMEMKSFDAEKAGPGVFIQSYAKLGQSLDEIVQGGKWGDFDLALYDESHRIQNVVGALRAQAAQRLNGLSEKSVYLSATPFEHPWDMEYLEPLGLWGKGTKFDGFESWLRAHGVARDDEGRLGWRLGHQADRTKMLMQIRREMMEKGVFSQREMQMDRKLENSFRLVAEQEPYKSYRNNVNEALAQTEEMVRGRMKLLIRSFRTTFNKRISELSKIPQAIEAVKQDLAEGRSALVMVGYKKDFALEPKTAAKFPILASVMEELDREYREVIPRLVRELGGEKAVAQIHGNIPPGKRKEELAGYMRGDKRVAVATEAAGGAGLSFHDLQGKFPRTQHNLTTPWTGKGAEQMAGRSYRLGQKTDTRMVWWGIDDPIEKELMQRTAAKMHSMGALVKGEGFDASHIKVAADKMAAFDFQPEEEITRELYGEPDGAGQDMGDGGVAAYNAQLGEASQGLLESARNFREQVATQATMPSVGATIPKPQPEIPKVADLVRPQDVIGDVARKLQVRTLAGFLGGGPRNAAGFFRMVADIVRMKNPGDIRVAAHEFGHFLDTEYFGFLKHPDKSRRVPIPGHLLPFVPELKPMAYVGADPRQIEGEGFAEYIRHYVTNPALAAQLAPTFHKYFEQHMGDVAPQDLKTLQEARALYDRYRQQSFVAKVGARVGVGPGQSWIPSMARTFRQWFSNWGDRHYVLKVLDDLGGEQGYDTRLRQLASMTSGADWSAQDQVSHGIVDLDHHWATGDVRRLSAGLPEILKDVDAANLHDAFRYYLVAEHAQGLRRQGFKTPFDDDVDSMRAVDQTVEWGRNDPEVSEIFQAAREGVKHYQDGLLKMLEGAGLLDPDLRNTFERLYGEHYVPFHRILGDPDHLDDWLTEVRQGGARVSKLGQLPPAIYRQHGSTRDIVDPIESIVGNTRYFTQLAFRHRVEKGLVDFFHRTYGPEGHGDWMEQLLRAPQVPSSYRVRRVLDALKQIGVDVDQVPEEDLDRMVQIWHPVQGKQLESKGVISIWDDRTSQRKWYAIHNPEVYQALVGLQPTEWNVFQRVAVAAARTLRAGVVGTPAFALRYGLRDLQTDFIQQKYGPTKDPAALPLVGPLQGMAEFLGKGKEYEKFVHAGGLGASLGDRSRAGNQEVMRRLLGSKWTEASLSQNQNWLTNGAAAWRMVTNVTKDMEYGLHGAASMFQNGIRTGAFMRSRAQGDDLLSAAYEGRNSPLDYAVHGAKARSYFLATAFLNPEIQGVLRAGRQLKEHPLQTMARASALTVISLGLAAANDGDKAIEQIPDELKQRYWFFRAGGTIWRLPKTYVYGDLFASLPEAFYDYMKKDDPNFGKRVLRSLKMGAGFNMVPTVALPALEVAMNKSLYWGTPIEPKNEEEKLLPQYRAGPATSSMSRRLSEAMAKYLGEDHTLSPRQIDHLVRGYFGQMGNDLWQGLATIPGVAKPNEGQGLTTTSFQRRYLVRDFTVAEPIADAKSVTQFYDDRDKAAKAAGSYVTLGDTKEAADFALEHAHELDVAPFMDYFANQLADLRRQRNATADPERQKAIGEKAIAVAQAALKFEQDIARDPELARAYREEREAHRETTEPLTEAKRRIDEAITTGDEAGIEKVIDSAERGKDVAELRKYANKQRRAGSLLEAKIRGLPKKERRAVMLGPSGPTSSAPGQAFLQRPSSAPAPAAPPATRTRTAYIRERDGQGRPSVVEFREE